MREHGQGGHIVNTSSMAGILQYSSAGIYVATKLAVVGLSEALRAELAPEGIGMSAFCPGGVRTNIREYEKTRPARFASHAAGSGIPRAGFAFSDEDRARMASLTASPEEAGELVLQGIRDNALYIFTAPEFRPRPRGTPRGDLARARRGQGARGERARAHSGAGRQSDLP
jgi:short-subunit dehydrogenase